IEGCKKNQIPEEVARKIWDWIEPFGSYSFNRSHSCAYAFLAYQTAFLKAHYPVEFMASLLSTKRADVERIGFLIEECKKMGIEVLPPDINESYREFSVVPGKKQIRFGLLSIKNVGENTVEAILKERKERGPFKSFVDFLSRMDPKDLNKKTMESLIKAGVFDKLAERNLLLYNLETILEWNREYFKTKATQQMGLFSNLTKSQKLSLKPVSAATKKEKLIWEKQLLGLFVSGHLAENLEKIFEKIKVFPLNQITEKFAGKVVKIGGVITAIKKIITKSGNPMYFAKVEDGKGQIEMVVFPAVLMKKPQIFQEHKAIIATGRIDNKDGIPKLICEEAEEIIES
ncbi:DNA polymerase III subunit alpha, partial [Candidatus Parcubacteria bacterium]|nr:DNA polymerase III subunit alpha [Candidatus Parcubacteria bacterium]